ncbi:glycerophosphoryl diester phosphodiesterase [Okibacterium sp. HSC-33S16]|uniref:glycerophosphodiester phosphodiesterase family protein n=1 Tax=Okibacterium sp. HSC-33S16 TaxID=2910965 RepID=UPI00209CC88B|nr:glycerophosphodiester phosphodiesterase family protein [Okibacterium sp. HSC-33S16]MCP2032793.1 glycerophosphoryl diester phosphodiesterase [Okibacterium sp. HSC-33S16]
MIDESSPQSRFLTPQRPRVFAHRGLALGVPENTLAAFQAAIDVGAEYIETDVHATADGIAVLVHDPDVTVDGVVHTVRDLTLHELSEVDLGGGHRVPTLAAALNRFGSTRFNIDVKSEHAPEPTAHAIRAASATDRVLVTSFDERRRVRAIDQLTAVTSSASSRLVTRALIGAKAGSVEVVRRSLAGVPVVQIPERHRNIQLVTPRSLSTMHRAGVEVHVWTVNDVSDMERLLALGVDGLITDRVDLALPLVDAWRSRSR